MTMKTATAEKLNVIVCEFFAKQEKFRAVEEKFKTAKAEFYAAMEKAMQDEKSFVCDTVDDSLVVEKVERVTVDFDAKKLLKRLTKKQAAQIVSKRYVIDDTDGFIAYLRECGCNPDVLRDFMQTELSVDKKALDRLHDIGEVSKENIAGCYSVKKSKPYFTVKRERNDGSYGRKTE